MNRKFKEAMEDCPIIAAVKDQEGLEKCLQSDIKIIFILFGDICNIAEIVKKVKEAERIAMVHIDLINGLGSKEISVDFIKQTTEADGIITTRPAMIKRAKELKLYTVLRYFVLDSMALKNIEKQKAMVNPDYIEILPGVMPKIITKICKLSNAPVIAGGLIQDKEDVMMALGAGASSISSTDPEVWFL